MLWMIVRAPVLHRLSAGRNTLKIDRGGRSRCDPRFLPICGLYAILFNMLLIRDHSDSLTMVACTPFAGAPNSMTKNAQPFFVSVAREVLLLMDLHSHLVSTEIIGFLAGHWDVASKHINVQAAFPCRSIHTGADHVNVEMDPDAELEVRRKIKERELRIVGWYHSHPSFQPDPSLVDLENQKNYQRLFRDEDSGDEPFIGAIVGPYDVRLPDSCSVINWFYVSNHPEERGLPKQVKFELGESCAPLTCLDSALELISEYKQHPDRLRLDEPWRPSSAESRIDKLALSLRQRMSSATMAASSDPLVIQREDTNKENDEFLARVRENLLIA